MSVKLVYTSGMSCLLSSKILRSNTFLVSPDSNPTHVNCYLYKKSLIPSTFFEKSNHTHVQNQANMRSTPMYYQKTLLIFNMYRPHINYVILSCTYEQRSMNDVNIFVKSLVVIPFFERNTYVHMIKVNPKHNAYDTILSEETINF